MSTRERTRLLEAVAKAARELGKYDDLSEPLITGEDYVPDEPADFNAVRLELHTALKELAEYDGLSVAKV